MPIDASKPTPLRLWGFLLTVGGGGLVAFGAIQVWVNITVGGKTLKNAVTWKGIDVPEGLVAFVCGVVLVVGILALRAVRGKAKRVVATLLIVAGVTAFAMGGVLAVTAVSRFSDNPLVAARLVAAREQIPLDLALAQVGNHPNATLGVGVFLTVLGGILGAVGGVLSLALVTRPPGSPGSPEPPIS